MNRNIENNESDNFRHDPFTNERLMEGQMQPFGRDHQKIITTIPEQERPETRTVFIGETGQYFPFVHYENKVFELN